MDNSLSNFGPRSKYERFFIAIKQRILKGEFGYRSKLPSDNTFASMYSISRPTIAKALCELNTEGLVERRVGDGTYVIFRPSENLNIGLLVPGLREADSLFTPTCVHLASYAHQNNVNLMWGLSVSNNDVQLRDKISETAQQYIDSKIACVVYSPYSSGYEDDNFNQTILNEFDKAKIPVVLFEADIVRFPNRSKFDLVTTDNFRAGFLITQHLLESGSKRVDFISQSVLPYSADLRIQGYQNALLQKGIIPQKNWVHNVNPDNFSAYPELFHPPVEAVICINDSLAAKYLNEFSNHFLRDTDDIKVTGFDGSPLSHYLNPPLTTFQHSCEQLSRLLFQVLMDRIRNKNSPPRTVFANGTLIIRQSSMTTIL
jgi:GntR family transcriptional regulator, arabinose operon transcriptional repressor